MAKKDAAAAPAGAGPAASEPSAGTDVTVAQKNALAMANLMSADAAAGKTGFEEAGAEAYAIPFLQILQSGSPQCKRSDGAFIDGAAEGQFYNTVTQKLYEGEDKVDKSSGEVTKGGIILIPCHYSQRFIEWKPRDDGGGFVAEHLPTDGIVLTTVKDEDNRDALPNGNILVDTRNHYVLLLNPDGSFEICVVSMSSTQLKKSRGWMSRMQQLKIKDGTKFLPAPMASHSYIATTVPEKNDKGAWMGWRIALNGPVTDPALYQAAQDFRGAVIKGTAKAVQPAAPGDEIPIGGSDASTAAGGGAENF